ncbi:MAG: acyl-CoA reductase [Proteobacteria bacterium]|nr:MAG: acyl-CoA reductase [Pseudomonadota bacterium]
MSVVASRSSFGPISYSDPFVQRLYNDIGALIEGDAIDERRIARELEELAIRNNAAVREYWRRTERGLGAPDSAFRAGSLFHFKDAMPVRAFRTSGTSGQSRGVAEYSERGLDLMRCSVIANARRHIFGWLDRPTVIRLVPDVRAVPDGVMAYGMALLSETFGDPATSACIVGPKGLDVAMLIDRVERAISERRPIVMIGGSFAFVHLCDALSAQQRRWVVPQGSRIVDAGGFKGRSRELDVDVLRGELATIFGVSHGAFTNIFGMTELASQLYDASQTRVGPKGERPKHPLGFVQPRVRDPFTWSLTESGPGLLEVADLCVIDRPHVVLTGDWGIASREGIAITGRVVASESRGCALAFESPGALVAKREEDNVHAGA